MTADWRAVNLAHWESRVPLHLGAGGYDLAAFDDPAHLSDTVRFDLPRLGSLAGLDVVHLQCHLGTDTISLARLGAGSVTGLEFSPSALTAARALATRTGTDVTFVEADVYAAVDALGPARFDLVYTGIGALNWHPDLARWAEVVAALLRTGGRLFVRDGHPVLLALEDPRPDGLLVLQYPYVGVDGGVPLRESTSYAGEGELTSPELVHFPHGLGELVTAVLAAGLRVDALEEHLSAPWNPLGDAAIADPDHPGEYTLAERPERLPWTYTLQASTAP
jgi:SAM-dependent methyltransferase